MVKTKLDDVKYLLSLYFNRLHSRHIYNARFETKCNLEAIFFEKTDIFINDSILRPLGHSRKTLVEKHNQVVQQEDRGQESDNYAEAGTKERPLSWLATGETKLQGRAILVMA